MKKKIKSFLIFYICFLSLGIFSCAVDDCGPFPNKFNVTSFDWSVNSAVTSNTPGEDVDLSEIVGNTVSFDRYSILMLPKRQTFFSLNDMNLGVRFFDTAYACTPAPPTTDNRITNITITANEAFNAVNSSGENLVSLFDVVVNYSQNNSISNQRIRLTDFLNDNPVVPDRMILLLNTAPDVSKMIEFHVTLNLQGDGISNFELFTEPYEIIL